MTMIQQVLKESGGTVFAVSEEDIIAGVHEMAKEEGIYFVGRIFFFTVKAF
jgi:threonine synthase